MSKTSYGTNDESRYKRGAKARRRRRTSRNISPVKIVRDHLRFATDELDAEFEYPDEEEY